MCLTIKTSAPMDFPDKNLILLQKSKHVFSLWETSVYFGRI